MSRRCPDGFRKQCLNQPLHPLGLFEFEQIRHALGFGFSHQVIGAKCTVAPQKGRSCGTGDATQKLPQAGARVRRRGLFPGPDFHIQGQPKVPNKVGVIGVRGATRLVWIVPDLGPLLVPIERLDRHVHIQDPGFRQQRFVAPQEMRLEPLGTGGLVKRPQGASHRIFTANLAHAQQGRIDAIGPNRGDVGIPPVSRQNR